MNKRKKLTNEKFVNLFKNEQTGWVYASRTDEPSERANAVVIAAIHTSPEGKESLVITKEWRDPLQDFEYGFPAGLLEADETIQECVKRELKEETGLDLTEIGPILPRTYNSSGLSDESVQVVFVNCKGVPSREFLQDNENIETILVRKSPNDFFKDPNKKFSTNCLLISAIIISYMKE